MRLRSERPRAFAETARAAFSVWAVMAVGVLSACASDRDEPISIDPRLQNPLLGASQFNETAPDVFRARLETTAGAFIIEVHRDWAPSELTASTTS